MGFECIWNEFISEDDCGIWPLGHALLQYLKVEVIITSAVTFITGCKRGEQIILISKGYLMTDVDTVSSRGEECLLVS